MLWAIWDTTVSERDKSHIVTKTWVNVVEPDGAVEGVVGRDAVRHVGQDDGQAVGHAGGRGTRQRRGVA